MVDDDDAEAVVVRVRWKGGEAVRVVVRACKYKQMYVCMDIE